MSKQFSNFPSTKMLPMEDIANELKIIHKFASSDQKSIDTESVAGVPASKIAMVALDEFGNPYKYQNEKKEVYIEERESVKNALYLDGKKAEEYLTKEEGAVIENFGENVARTYADELAALRDELYQLRGELARDGFVRNYDLYAGFQDFFKTSDKKYLQSKVNKNGEIVEDIVLCGLSSSFVDSTNVNKIIPSQIGIIKKGDWFIISKTDTDEHYLVRATNVELLSTEEEVTFESFVSQEGIPSIKNPTAVAITKVHGDYYDSTFSFSNIESYKLKSKERYTMLNDDKNTSMKKILEDRTGFATSFNMPSQNTGVLKSISIMANAKGSPGALTCYILKEDEITEKILNLSTEEIGEDKVVLAKSLPVSYTDASSNVSEIEFDFKNSINDKYTEIKGMQSYRIVIVTEKADQNNYWQIQFSSYKSQNGEDEDLDVQRNNIVYSYTQGSGFELNNNMGDIIFTVATIEVENNAEVPRTQGLYTSKKISINNNSSLARARLTMRINREGIFSSETNGIVNDNGLIKVKTSGINPDNLGIKQNDTIIIGNQIRKAISDVNGKTIGVNKALLVEEDMPVYKVGYQVFLRAIKNKWETGPNPRYVIESDICLPMELKAVMSDTEKAKNKENSSDRLIFECEFRDERQLPIDANEYYLQVVWKSHLTQSEIMTNPAYTGRIYDLTLSFDRTL